MGNFIEMFADCPWMATDYEYAVAVTEALKAGASEELEKLSAFGRKYAPFRSEPIVHSAATIPCVHKLAAWGHGKSICNPCPVCGDTVF